MVEGLSAPFQNIRRKLFHIRSVNRTGSSQLGPPFFLIQHADPLGVSKDGDVRVVSRENELPLCLARA